MATIDKLDISVYNLYAIRTRMIEQINQQFQLDQAASIPAQLQVLDNYPKPTELDVLLGIAPLYTPWAYFFPPPRFRFMRRSPFSYRVIPSFGSYDEQALHEQKLEEVLCRTPEEKQEKETLKSCFREIEKLNNWLNFIVGRVGQFLQG
ncbi:hypothetical protein DB42_EA00100 [Neochlamydia sp. EPS4]|jgi:hypothetical protein|uniref:DUF5399 domain-containing protein n=1 Tax=unclassified Neochlamydia TaxID=2643326 RepID=UPI000580685B|nr:MULTISPECIES: DUF5399 domain-containing protein [unclassified Neochlamydia]KIC76138.1 hypothetical protein DB42_EA00100 [Neochlamydia sp. EPS4]KIC77168.1 hypothetical protein DB41_CV00060 [Neochlamydia sp. TUME1]BBI17649.1 Putative uncharacterized protein [Neochlamydia sp. S13]